MTDCETLLREARAALAPFATAYDRYATSATRNLDAFAALSLDDLRAATGAHSRLDAELRATPAARPDARDGVVEEPAAWMFELARYYGPRGYTGWGRPQLSFNKPSVPEGSIRNLQPLYAALNPRRARDEG